MRHCSVEVNRVNTSLFAGVVTCKLSVLRKGWDVLTLKPVDVTFSFAGKEKVTKKKPPGCTLAF